VRDLPRALSVAGELALACSVAGVTQRELARRLGLSQTTISRLLSGSATLHFDVADAIARACGNRLLIRVLPGDGIRLRDSGQLAMAQVIERSAHHAWVVRLEVAVGPPPDMRAVDVVLMGPDEVVAIEIERSLRDLQAQLRAAKLKRVALAERMVLQVRLVLAVPDGVAARRRLQPFGDLIVRELPISSRTAWARIRSGEPLGGDALLWVRR
jgi:transcriptional regulator with XRE-family HTH domain